MVVALNFKSVSPYTFTSSAGKNQFRFTIKYSIGDDSYFMDIEILENNKYKMIAQCIRLSCGVDVFLPYKRYGLGTLLVVPTDSRNYADNNGPTADTILNRYCMVWEHD